MRAGRAARGAVRAQPADRADRALPGLAAHPAAAVAGGAGRRVPGRAGHGRVSGGRAGAAAGAGSRACAGGSLSGRTAGCCPGMDAHLRIHCDAKESPAVHAQQKSSLWHAHRLSSRWRELCSAPYACSLYDSCTAPPAPHLPVPYSPANACACSKTTRWRRRCRAAWGS